VWICWVDVAPWSRTKFGKRYFMRLPCSSRCETFGKYLAPPCELLSLFLCGWDFEHLWLYKELVSTMMAIVRSIRKIGLIIDFTGN
jgi:hypothetical protein